MADKTKTPASEFRKDLKAKNPGLSATFVDRLVKSEIDAGNVEDDGAKGLLASIPTDALVKSAQNIEKTLGINPPDADPVAKSSDFGADALGRLSFVEEVSKSVAGTLESVIDYQRDAFPVMLRAQQAQGMTIQGVVDALGHVFGLLDDIKKGMREPIPPRGASGEGGGKLPHPSEQAATAGDPIAKGALSPLATVTAINAAVLRDRLMDAKQDLIEKGGGAMNNPHEKEILKLGGAIVALESGERSDAVIKRFGIKFEATPAAATGT